MFPCIFQAVCTTSIASHCHQGKRQDLFPSPSPGKALRNFFEGCIRDVTCPPTGNVMQCSQNMIRSHRFVEFEVHPKVEVREWRATVCPSSEDIPRNAGKETYFLLRFCQSLRSAARTRKGEERVVSSRAKTHILVVYIYIYPLL